MQRFSPLNSPTNSLPSSPLLQATPAPPLQQSLPLLTFLNSPETAQAPQRRLLIPTVRPTRVPPPRPQRQRNGKITRQTRSASLGAELLSNRESKEWVSSLGKMHIVEDQVEVRGYQIHAVEKWVVDRGRLINVVTVYTGNPAHKITVTVLTPFSSLTDAQAQAEFDNAVYKLRRDGARPRETEYGTLLTTSLANFRSDYNLVLIPGGNFLVAREQLYVNINLLRMGCSGRSALTLEEPSEPTKDRYLSMYSFSESVLSGMPFNHAVLELVKLVQCALALFGMFDVSSEERNGLLCDVTAEGIQHWTDQVGEPLLSLEPMERVGDPSVVSALLSLVVTMRNKLHAIGLTQVPKDPFHDPEGFMHTVATLHTQKPPPPATLPSSAGCLTLETVQCINHTYDNRRAPEYRVPRMILNKLDDITTDLNLRGPVDQSFAAGHVYATADLAGFVQMVVSAGHKDTIESLKALWTGKAPRRKKTKKDGLGVDDDEKERTDGKSTEEEDGVPSLFPSWGKHMKGFDFGLGRSKKPSVDLTSQASKTRMHKSLSADEAAAPLSAPLLPSLVISGDSGAEGSPHSANPSSFGMSPAVSARSSNVNLVSSPEVTQAHPSPLSLPLRRPTLPTRLPSRLSTISDPLTSSREERKAFSRRASAYEQHMHEDEDEDEDLEIERRANRGLLLAAQRRHSMHDLSNVRDRPRLAVERMKIDVGLCGQYLIMRRRELHLQNMTALLRHLSTTLSTKNTRMQHDLSANEEALANATHLRQDVWTALDAAEARLVDWGKIQDMLQYQTDQMVMKNLWRNVRQQRGRVLSARQAVFGAAPGTRPQPGTANRRFFRVQTTLDPQEQRLVDWLGRTESEAEEESGIPEESGGMWALPYEELRAYAEVTKEERPARARWWWPFGRMASGKVSDDETTQASVTVQGEEAAITLSNMPNTDL